jgi:hypothetical protein
MRATFSLKNSRGESFLDSFKDINMCSEWRCDEQFSAQISHESSLLEYCQQERLAFVAHAKTPQVAPMVQLSFFAGSVLKKFGDVNQILFSRRGENNRGACVPLTSHTILNQSFRRKAAKVTVRSLWCNFRFSRPGKRLDFCFW